MKEMWVCFTKNRGFIVGYTCDIAGHHSWLFVTIKHRSFFLFVFFVCDHVSPPELIIYIYILNVSFMFNIYHSAVI